MGQRGLKGAFVALRKAQRDLKGTFVALRMGQRGLKGTFVGLRSYAQGVKQAFVGQRRPQAHHFITVVGLRRPKPAQNQAAVFTICPISISQIIIVMKIQSIGLSRFGNAGHLPSVRLF